MTASSAIERRRAASKLAAVRRKAIDDGYGPGGRMQGRDQHKVQSVAEVLSRLRARLAERNAA